MLQDLIAIKKKGPGGPIGHWGRGTSASLATNIEAIPTTLLPTSENFKKNTFLLGGGTTGFPGNLQIFHAKVFLVLKVFFRHQSFTVKKKQVSALTSWWLNQPIWKIASFPQFSGWTKKWWKHHLVEIIQPNSPFTKKISKETLPEEAAQWSVELRWRQWTWL